MTSPYLLPDWLPWWIALILVVIGLVYALILLLVPFSVFGVKPRLEAIEEQLLAMQEDLRGMALRLNAAPRRGGISEFDETPLRPRPPLRQAEPRPAEPRQTVVDPPLIPPIPPPPRDAVSREPLSRDAGRQRGGTPQRLVSKRIEPRLD